MATIKLLFSHRSRPHLVRCAISTVLNVELSKKIMSRALHRSVSTLVALLLTTASSSWLRPPPAVKRHAPVAASLASPRATPRVARKGVNNNKPNSFRQRRSSPNSPDAVVRLLVEARRHARNATAAVTHARRGLKLYAPEARSFEVMRKANQLLAALGDDGHLDAARSVYEAMIDAGLRPTQVTYGTLIARAGSCRQPKVAVSYYREMLRRGIQPDAQTHNSLINAFVKAGENEKALQVAESMRQRGVVPTLVTYNTLLDGAARHGNLTLARQTLSDMKKAGIRPSERTYSIMIHLCARRGLVDAAFGWFRRMEEANIRPNAVTYSTLLNCCGKAGQLERAFALLAEMELAASTEANEVESMSSLAEAAEAEHDEAAGRGRGEGRKSPRNPPLAQGAASTIPKPNVVTYTSLIDACAKARQPLRAVSVFRQMIENGVAPNDITCHALFSGCLQQGEVLLAREVLQYMTSVGLQPTAHQFTALLADAASGSAAFACLLRQLTTGQLTGGTPLLQPLPTTITAPPPSSSPSTPSSSADATSSTTTTSAQQKEDAAEAVKAADLQAMRELDADLVELVERELDADLESDLERAPQPFLADSAKPPAPELRRVFGIFGQMRALGVPADRAAYNALINACARAGDIPRAEGAFSEMLAAGINPDAISFSSLIKACAVAGDSQRADSIFTEMQQRTNHFSTYTPPSSHTYAHLMAVHRRAGQPERVLELLDEMSNSTDLKPRVVHFSLALQALSLWKDLPLSLPRAMKIYEITLKEGLRLDSRGILAIKRICEAHGRGDLARKVRQQRSMDRSFGTPRW